VPKSEQSRLPSLTGLRFVAAFAVVLAHTVGFVAFRAIPHEYDFSWVFFAAGNLAVSFFFILSGFILTKVAVPGDTPLLFWRRRIVKVFPNHLVTLAATVALMAFAGVAVTVANTVPSIFLVQTWIPVEDVIHINGGNTPAWTLACEAFFYAMFPLLVLAIRKIRAERLWLWVGILVLAVVAVPFLGYQLPDQPIMQWDPIPWWPYWFTYHFPVTRVLEFALGIVMAQIVIKGKWINLKLLPATGLVLVAFILSATLPGEFGRVAPAPLPMALFITAVAMTDMAGRRTVFSGRSMVWLGEISFALYLVHFPVVNYGPIGAAYSDYWGKTWTLASATWEIGITMVISVLLAWALYAFVEQPAMRRFARPKRKPVVGKKDDEPRTEEPVTVSA
jgi:peptidoglycan/LPS O-acetylase OafA/YrhL